MSKIAVVGDKDSILGFKALGISICPVQNRDEASKRLRRMAEEEYSIIFITEPLFADLHSLIYDLNREVFPAIIPIPNNRGSTGFAMERLRQLVEKAVGVDILFQKEGDS